MRRAQEGQTVKRASDIVVGCIALIVLSPVLAATAVAVRLNMGSPVIFRQRRVGLGDKPFDIFKFRTMRDGDGTDEERLTTLGRILRSSSLDELPELLNVIRGEMSLVGPRPLHVRYLERYSPRQRRRHDVRPGITGLAQANGRNDLDWNDRLELDVVYVETATMRLDLRILLATVSAVVRREGISGGDTETMSEFVGAGNGEA
jgi:lipopolysaccharide/colanic/teichoic acid biosynthesis glycosyltransferase